MSKIAAIKTHDLNNGPGIRVSVWFAGCDFRCEGCHNKETWDFNNGYEFNDDILELILEALNGEQNLSILGGEPLHIKNRNATATLIKKVKERYPDKTIWLWSGFTIDELKKMDDENIKYVLSTINALIDGRFEIDKKEEDLKYFGSTNQNIIIF